MIDCLTGDSMIHVEETLYKNFLEVDDQVHEELFGISPDRQRMCQWTGILLSFVDPSCTCLKRRSAIKEAVVSGLRPLFVDMLIV